MPLKALVHCWARRAEEGMAGGTPPAVVDVLTWLQQACPPKLCCVACGG